MYQFRYLVIQTGKIIRFSLLHIHILIKMILNRFTFNLKTFNTTNPPLKRSTTVKMKDQGAPQQNERLKQKSRDQEVSQ